MSTETQHDSTSPHGAPATHGAEAKKMTAREINNTLRYTAWSVFRAASPLPEDREALAREVDAVVAGLEAQGLEVRGFYDLSGLRADADLMIWWHAPSVETIQAAYNGFRRTSLGVHLEAVWSNMAVHRPAEFNKGHVPAFMAGEEPRAYICVYPFVRSYEWYILPDDERRKMLVDHGMKAREFPDVRANTVPAFALGDYEWILAFEADEMHRIVDLMRELRATEARLHVRVEVPFFAGPRRALSAILASLP